MNAMQATVTKGPIYLDNQATTATDPRVVDAMLPYFTEIFGNAHSSGHAFGWQAEDAVEAARQKIADLIGAEQREIIFTSGATESNNLAIKGLARFNRARGDHLITTEIEHKCVLESFRRLEKEGFRVTYLAVKANGLIDLDALAAAIEERTLLVSVIGVHNEIGVIQPLADIAALCRRYGVQFHTDCAQAVGKTPLDVNQMQIDLLSISAHKMYGPMGIGALYVRRRPRVRLEPLFDGGGQERGLRSGTLPVPLCVGMGEAALIAGREMADESGRLTALRNRLLNAIRAQVADVQINGDLDRRVSGNLNLMFPHISGDDLVSGLKGLAISTGSACTSATIEPSYVLRALGLNEADAAASVRIGLGRFTTEAEIDKAGSMIVGEVLRLRGEGKTSASASAA
ncbi:MAG: IscS subfamily cysteine desulfurase [Rhodospirillales bacterium]|nr:IscS subfamily cysteine desulfurase [Rhodospirillales bacterium]